VFVRLGGDEPIQIAYAFFASAAEFSPEGKLYVLGGCLSSIGVTAFPGTAPPLTLVLFFRAQPEDCGREHVFRGEFLGPNAQALVQPFDIRLSPVADPRHPDKPVSSGMAITISGIECPEAGEYTMRILTAGHVVGESSITVLLADGAGAVGGSPASEVI
jgi:hypothetical protein